MANLSIKAMASQRRLKHRTLLGTLLLAGLMMLAGCAPEDGMMIDERDERHFRRAESLYREGRKQEALSAYLEVIEARRDAPESHLEAGRIYLDHIEDPVTAIYHFRQYLMLKPDADKSVLVRQLIDTAKKEFARSLPGQPFAESVDRLDLMEQLERVKEENLVLKQQVAALRRGLQEARAQPPPAVAVEQTRPQPTAPAIVQRRPQPVPATPGERVEVYAVQAGDTLSSISRKVYGTSGRWRDIFEANRGVLANPNAVRVGQELRIPWD